MRNDTRVSASLGTDGGNEGKRVHASTYVDLHTYTFCTWNHAITSPTQKQINKRKQQTVRLVSGEHTLTRVAT